MRYVECRTMPRYDIMRFFVEDLRAEHASKKRFLKALKNSPYGGGFYAEAASDYASWLLRSEEAAQ